MTPQENGGVFASWGLVESAITLLAGAVSVIARYVYGMSVRVKLLEDGSELRETNVERRHKENLAAWNRIDERVGDLTRRLDGIVDRQQMGIRR